LKLVIENLLAAFGAVFLGGIHSSFPRLQPRRASPRLSVRRSLAIASSGACHCSQVSEARRIAEVDRYRHSSRDGRHERKIVRQLEQVGNRQGESNIAVKRDILLLAAARLCTPLARRSVLIEEDHRETSRKLRPGDPPLGLQVRERQDDLTVLMNAPLRVLLQSSSFGRKASNPSRR
jgi:hypothetical protein